MAATDFNKQILIVDRDVASVEPLRQRLSEMGFTVRGADDYVSKPFSMREVVARVCSLLRTHQYEDRRSVFSGGELVLDGSTNRVTAQGRLLNLRGIEYRLLEFLMAHPGRTFNRTQLLAQVWGGDSDSDERTVDVNVQRLRKILTAPGCDAYLQTVRGFGYRFAVPSAAPAPAPAAAVPVALG
ncbi:MAG TPA: winged helix-turn-helix domain-containing protein [Steroidobacteraceae bacterium]|jgi:two-component system phosphate regulon response regulator PhoB|nr:winged helix-turn-helix domain-containing protein [Steroidobacteraceae bacterium]